MRLTAEQYDLVAGRPPGAPYPVAALLVLLAYGHAVLALLPAGAVALFAAWTVSRLGEARALRAALPAPAPVLLSAAPAEPADS